MSRLCFKKRYIKLRRWSGRPTADGPSGGRIWSEVVWCFGNIKCNVMWCHIQIIVKYHIKWQIADEARRAELAIIISYPNKEILKSASKHWEKDVYTYNIPRSLNQSKLRSSNSTVDFILVWEVFFVFFFLSFRYASILSWPWYKL